MDAVVALVAMQQIFINSAIEMLKQFEIIDPMHNSSFYITTARFVFWAEKRRALAGLEHCFTTDVLQKYVVTIGRDLSILEQGYQSGGLKETRLFKLISLSNNKCDAWWDACRAK